MLLAFLIALSALAHAGDPADDARRIVAILDYVATDYGGAVRDGVVLNEGEYAEQTGFVEDAARIAASLPPSKLDTVAGMAALQEDVARLAPAASVAADAAHLRAGLVEAYGVSLVPGAPLSRTKGSSLYVENCASCHGTSGGGDTDTARQLTPPPRNFRDPEVMEVLSPARAFNALTDGVSGTAMPAFTQLSIADRWDLAFYVFTLRHDPESEARGAEPARGIAADVAMLSAANDGEFEAALPGLSGAERSDAVAWLRGVAPYQGRGRSMAVARKGIDEAMVLFHGGDRPEAGRHLTDVYLRGFEPHEATLRQAAPELVTQIEDGFLSLRAMIDGDASAEEVAAKASAVRALLDRAEPVVTTTAGTSMAFAGGFLVFLREGVEAALVVLLLLGFARSRGPREVWGVHAGWIGALAAGTLTWWASEWLVGIAGAQREAVEGFTALLAALFMVSAHHWLASRAAAARRVGAIQAVMGAGALAWWTLPALSFGAVYREAFEVVLFLQAILLDSAASPWAVVAGCAAATALLIAGVAFLLRVGSRLPVGPALTVASILLSLMAVVFAGKGVHALQEAGYLGVTAFPLARVAWLGVFPTLQTTVAQLLLVLALAVSAVIPRLARGGEPDAAATHAK